MQNVQLTDGLLFTSIHGDLRAPIQVLEDPEDSWVGLGVQLSGSISTKMDNRTVGLTPRTFNFIRGNSCKASTVFAPDQTHYHGVHFKLSPAFFESIVAPNMEYFSNLKTLLNHTDPFKLSEQPIHVGYVVSKLTQDILSCSFQGSMKRTYLEAKFLELFMQVDQVGDFKFNKEKDLFYGIKDYLDTHFNETLSLQGIARKFGINDFKLKKGFKETFKKTVFEYIIARRLQTAFDTILNTQQSLVEVASTMGYKSPAHFSTAFKRQFGITPSQVRK
jgi:AraC-like DNA-binding protein